MKSNLCRAAWALRSISCWLSFLLLLFAAGPERDSEFDLLSVFDFCLDHVVKELISDAEPKEREVMWWEEGEEEEELDLFHIFALLDLLDLFSFRCFDHSKNFTRSFRLLDFLSSSLHYQTLFNLQQSNPLPSSTIFDTRKKDTSTLEKGRTIHESMSRRINILAKLFGCIELPCLVLQNHEDMIREQQQQQRGYELSSHRKLHRPEWSFKKV